MPEYPDQHLIDELYRNLKGEDLNGGGNGAGGRGGRSKASPTKLNDKAVLDKVFGEKQRGEEFRSIYSGDYASYHAEWTNSEAVAAMLRKLAFYTSNDPVQMERLIRDSGLDRIKYDSPRVGSTWLREEIGKAIEATPETFRPDRPDRPLWDKSGRSGGSKYFDGGILVPERAPLEVVQLNLVGDPGPQKWLVEGLWPLATTCLLHGDGGAAKSIIALSLGMAIGRGAPQWLGYSIAEQEKVLYIDFELTAEDQRRRMLQLLAGEGIGTGEFPSQNLLYLSASGRVPKEVYSMAYRWCEEHGVKVVLVDSVGFGMIGNPGDNFEILSFFQECVDVFRRDFGASVLAVDHQRRATQGESYQDLQAYGGVYKNNCVRSRIQVQLTGPGKEEQSVIMRHGKANFGAAEDPFKVKVDFTEGKIRISRTELTSEELQHEKAKTARDRILLALNDEDATKAKLAEELQMPESTVKNGLGALKKHVPPLVKEKEIKEGNAPVHALTDAGREAVEAMLHVPEPSDLDDEDQLEI